jgi:lipoate-protein ligase A
LRLYAWQPFCLSIGYGQRAGDADRQRLIALGWDMVRRPTGGRAILHGDELTYSLVLPAGHSLAAGSVMDSYQRISRALLAGLRFLNVAPEANQSTERVRSGPVCFETPSHYELVVEGRKLIGSAQLRREAGVLQHGSLPLSGDITRICDVLCYADETSREAARRQVRARATTLGAMLNGGAVPWPMAAEAIIAGFRTAFDVELVVGELTPAERDLAVRLGNEVYANPAWTFRR